jgi:hypothetical protein
MRMPRHGDTNGGKPPPRKLRFTDGMEFDVDGELRVVHRKDGWYVVGQGMLMPVDSPEDGARLIEKLARKQVANPPHNDTD